MATYAVLVLSDMATLILPLLTKLQRFL
jgi:hypothetical protein